jgi:cyclomaltodextrinase
MIQDVIFGDLMDEKVCLARQREAVEGVKHLNRLSPAIPTPGQPVTLILTTGGPQPFDAARCWFSADSGLSPTTRPGSGKIEGVLDMQLASVAWDEFAWGYVKTWTCSLPPQLAGTQVHYHLAAHVTGCRQWIYADNHTEFLLWFDARGLPAWAREAVVYQVFLDRFYPGNNKPWLKPENLGGFFGGTLRGVIQKLDYIQGLGCNTVWLSPLFASPSHHGYDATDTYKVEPRLGSNADLKELLDLAHALGLRVLLDFVANHWSNLHPTFQAALADENSPYHDWYTWKNWPDDYETYFDVRGLPKLNLKPGPARNYLLDCASYWLTEGVDGYRLDYATGPQLDFWTDFRRACRAARPDCWLFGEVVHTAAVQNSFAGRLDGTLDFLLAQALRETFAQGNWRLDAFEAFLSAHEGYFAPDFSRPAFLDNHDMNRFLFLCGGDTRRLKLGALALFTLSAPPIVYYGTEAGVTQPRPLHLAGSALFEAARMPMKWGAEQDYDLVSYFRRLISLRHQHPVLPYGSRQVVHLDPEAGTYAYLRASNPGRPAPGDVLAAFNLSPEPRTLSLHLPGFSGTDLLNEQPVRSIPGEVEVTLAPFTGAFVAQPIIIHH